MDQVWDYLLFFIPLIWHLIGPNWIRQVPKGRKPGSQILKNHPKLPRSPDVGSYTRWFTHKTLLFNPVTIIVMRKANSYLSMMYVYISNIKTRCFSQWFLLSHVEICSEHEFTECYFCLSF